MGEISQSLSPSHKKVKVHGQQQNALCSRNGSNMFSRSEHWALNLKAYIFKDGLSKHFMCQPAVHHMPRESLWLLWTSRLHHWSIASQWIRIQWIFMFKLSEPLTLALSFFILKPLLDFVGCNWLRRLESKGQLLTKVGNASERISLCISTALFLKEFTATYVTG